MNRLQQAARTLADYDTAWQMFETRAVLAGWVEARQRGLSVETCDAIVIPAVAAIRDLIRQWADEDPADESGSGSNSNRHEPEVTP